MSPIVDEIVVNDSPGWRPAALDAVGARSKLIRHHLCAGVDGGSDSWTSDVVVGCTVTGTDGRDVPQGTRGDDVLCGLGGNDVILGGDGNDTILGGDGNDILSGVRGDDTPDGGGGLDLLVGWPGFDTCTGEVRLGCLRGRG